MSSFWKECVVRLKDKLHLCGKSQQFDTWIAPLQAEYLDANDSDPGCLRLFAPNQFVLDRVKEMFFDDITEVVTEMSGNSLTSVILQIGSKDIPLKSEAQPAIFVQNKQLPSRSHLNPAFTFDNLVEGNSNRLARAASLQVAQNLGKSYNPLFIYGGVGLGKTHLLHAMGNYILQNNPGAKVLYCHSERYVAEMVRSLQNNTINDFKQRYRFVNVLFIDDIQFFAGKDRSQEELFHTFNALLEGQHQMIFTCDRYPKEVEGLEERLRSRFGWGLTVAIEPPELEMRVAILMSKAEQSKIELPHDVAFFIAKKLRSNVRELEGALKRVIANAHFTGEAITIGFVKEALKDLFSLQDKLVSIENIQKTVAEYYKIKLSDLLSKRRTRSIARPRQMAMALAKTLTNHSLPEIGEAFGGRDHTTVLHACRTIKELIRTNLSIEEDHTNLLRTLSS